MSELDAPDFALARTDALSASWGAGFFMASDAMVSFLAIWAAEGGAPLAWSSLGLQSQGL